MRTAATASALVLPWTPYTHLLFRPNHIMYHTSFNYHNCNSIAYKCNEFGNRNQAQFLSPKSPSFSLKCSLNQPLPQDQQGKGFWNQWKAKSAEMSSKLAKLGLAAVLAYGLFDGVTYTSFFVIAFLGYEKSTGMNPAANLQALLGIVILMWTGNNVTRPFRVAGAAALAPFIDKVLKKIENYFKFPSVGYAFALVVSIIAAFCGTIVGLLILSRWGR